MRIDSVAFHSPEAELENLCEWFEKLGWIKAGSLGSHGHYYSAGDLCVEVSSKWPAPSHGEPYWVVEDLDEFLKECAQKDIKILEQPRNTGNDAKIMCIGGPANVKLWVLCYDK